MSVSTLGQEPLPQRLEHEQSQSHDHEVHDRGQYEYQVPAAGRRFDQIGNRNQERRRTPRMPPAATTSLGPRRSPRLSTIQPWIGVSQVSSAMKILNASWIDAIDQPWALLMGLTKIVQPYCRLAISIMHKMQQMS